MLSIICLPVHQQRTAEAHRPTPASLRFPGLRSGDGLADAGTALSRAQVMGAAGNIVRLLNSLLGLGQDQLDVARVRHVRVDLRWCQLVPNSRNFLHAVENLRGTYATVGTVCPPALLGGLVDLDVLDNQIASVETLGVGVRLGVAEETQDVLGGFDGPAGAGDAESLACARDPISNVFLHECVLPAAQFTIPLLPEPSLHARHCLLLPDRDARERCVCTLRASSSAAGISSHRHGLLVLLHILEEGDGALELPAVDGLGGLARVLERDSEVGAAGAGRLGRVNFLRCVPNLFEGEEN
jgi:hypothetical protein